jgi:hypothetical protein
MRETVESAAYKMLLPTQPTVTFTLRIKNDEELSEQAWKSLVSHMMIAAIRQVRANLHELRQAIERAEPEAAQLVQESQSIQQQTVAQPSEPIAPLGEPARLYRGRDNLPAYAFDPDDQQEAVRQLARETF